MPKLRPEKVAGIVALSYLALIPTGGLIAWLKVRQMDRDLSAVWEELKMGSKTDPAPDPYAHLRDAVRTWLAK